MEEARDYVKVMRDAGIDTVFLAAPTSTDHRLKLVAEYSSGFIYLVSRTGITGEQTTLSDTALPLIERMRALTDLPLAVGFGISTAAQVAAIAEHADAVVVGSAIVRQIGKDPSGVEALMRVLTQPLGGGLAGSAKAVIS